MTIAIFLGAYMAIVCSACYGLGYLHGRGHRFIDRIFGRDS